MKQTERHDDELMCYAEFNSLCITPEGNVQPCCAFPLKLGNVRNTSLPEILNGNKTLDWQRKFRTQIVASAVPQLVQLEAVPVTEEVLQIQYR